ncbi:MAG: flagellar basal-body rod protein FlgF [Chloroflexi bacterium]|nr:flagellar basal-body rod protein FlgF [Chloroflexota bacterium]
MIRGIYASASSMLTLFSKQMVINNNLANVQTTGYKQDIANEEASPGLYLNRTNDLSSPFIPAGMSTATPVGTLGTGVAVGESTLDMTQGQLEETGNPLDMALSGSGFFSVQTNQGVLYTRDGSFVRNPDGRLTTANGELVLGQNGPIQIPEGEVQIASDGTVLAGGQQVDRLAIVEFPAGEQMVKTGGNLLQPATAGLAPAAATQTTVHQGFLERSNVDVTKAMVDMMAVARAYEASQKMIQFQDAALDKAVNEIARFS